MNTNLIILAGGMSSRMKKPSISKNISKNEEIEANQRSKSLISVGNGGRPLLDYLLYNGKKAGYKNIYIVINKEGKLFQKFYGTKKQDNDFNGLNISFVTQHIPKDRIKPFGTADALLQALDQYPLLKEDKFTVCNSDNLYSKNALNLLSNTEHDNAFISYDRNHLEFSLQKILSFAVVQLDENNYLKNIIEKPSEQEIEQNKDQENTIRVSMNIFKLNGKNIYPSLKKCPIHLARNEKELPTAILNMVHQTSNRMYGIPLAEHVPDLTAKDDIVHIKAYLQEHYPIALDW